VLILLLCGLIIRTFPAVPLADLAAGKWLRPRATVEGIVGRVTTEADGDVHIVLLEEPSKGKPGLLYARMVQRVICEIVPEFPLPAPKVGDRIRVRGIVRYDGWHKWYEIHPVFSWEKLP
jgi:hypothetical protein